MEEEQAVQAEETDEWRREHRVRDRLAEVEPVEVGVVPLQDPDERNVAPKANAHHLAAFQEDAFRSAVVETGKSFEIAALEGEIPS